MFDLNIRYWIFTLAKIVIELQKKKKRKFKQKENFVSLDLFEFLKLFRMELLKKKRRKKKEE